MTLQDLHKELLALSILRHRVLEANDPINRLFLPILSNEKTQAPTRGDLEKAVADFEAKVPGFYLWYSPWEHSYGLFPHPESDKK